MDLATKIKEYMCGVDVLRDYNSYKCSLGNDLYNRMYSCTSVLGRVIFDVSLLAGIGGLVEGRENDVGLAALIGGSSFLMGCALKYARKSVIVHKKSKMSSG